MALLHFVYHWSVEGHLGCFCLLVIRNNVATNILVPVFVWTYFFISLGYIPRSRIAGSHGNPMFSHLRREIHRMSVFPM